jgi:hemerythrin-like domain-containing protein
MRGTSSSRVSSHEEAAVTALELLMAEHRVIESVLDALERAAQALEGGKAVPAAFFIDAADFIRGYADEAHHRKEEGVLFKVMARYGFPEDQEPVSMMLAEHDEARQLTRRLHEAALGLQAGDAAAGEVVARLALAYASLLREHIEKEDHILYEMAQHAIPPAELDAMAEEFAAIERDDLGPEVKQRYEALAVELGRRAGA